MGDHNFVTITLVDQQYFKDFQVVDRVSHKAHRSSEKPVDWKESLKKVEYVAKAPTLPDGLQITFAQVIRKYSQVVPH